MLPGLRLNTSDTENERFMLDCLIRDVLVTRNWHTNSKLSVLEIKRGIRSLVDALRMLQCDTAFFDILCHTIDACISKVEQSYTVPHSLKLSIGSASRLLLMRHCHHLCDAVNSISEIERALNTMLKKPNSELDAHMRLVIKGRCEIYDGSSSGECMSVLQALCAVSHLLRSLGPTHAVAADACDADVLQLLERMQFCHESVLLASVDDLHQTT